MQRFIEKVNISVWLGPAIGILYGVIARLTFGNNSLEVYLTIMTLGFIVFVPLTLGVLTVYFAESQKPRRWFYWIFAPWISCVLLLLAAFVVGWEGSICILMASPVFLVMSSIGGLITGLVLMGRRPAQNFYSVVVLVVALPFASSALENQFSPPDATRLVENQILINATSQTVWKNIERVREIKPEEQRFGVFHLVGFPRPVEATLSYEGLGGVRHATFEGGVIFVETITRWEPEKELVFGIKADTKSIPPTTLDEHVTIGGRYFDMLEGALQN
jgi:hypothetical protein